MSEEEICDLEDKIDSGVNQITLSIQATALCIGLIKKENPVRAWRHYERLRKISDELREGLERVAQEAPQ